MTDTPPDDRPLERLDDRRSRTLDRREFLGFIGATVATVACGDMPEAASRSHAFPTIDPDADRPGPPPPRPPTLPDDPFTLGVASGDPLPDGVVLWTRLAPEPLEGGGMPNADVPVIWEIARAEDYDATGTFDEIVASGWLYTEPRLAHSAHVDVRGLQPDTWYVYRFRVGDQWTSPVARTRTFPRPDASPDRLRIASASCQKYTDGYYTAHRHMAEEEIDLVAFLGDYIYEYGRGGEKSVRHHQGPTLETLADFRQRYALYKSDPSLQASHANCPWVMTWDDHEVSNDYAGLEPARGGIADFKRMRAAAYQAYYEHMPLRIPFPDDPSTLEIHRTIRFGDLANISVLDGRQYRSGIICDGEFGAPCDDVFDPSEAMIGPRQRAWLVDTMTKSDALWELVCQQTVMTPINFENRLVNPDQWDGYQAERQQLLDFFGSEATDNVTVLTGDIHTAGFAELPADDDAPGESERVGVEIVATSITSGNELLSGSDDLEELFLDQLGNVHYFNPTKRGYCLLEYTRDQLHVQYRTVSTVESPEAELANDVEFTVDVDTLDFERM